MFGLEIASPTRRQGGHEHTQLLALELLA